jgi:crossover junction endodeoxyribonuclease RuvC
MSGETRGGAVGIDPGLDGALAVIGPDGVEVFVAPTIGGGRAGRRRPDAAAMAQLLAGLRVELAVVEAVGAMPKQGVTSTFTFGVGFGIWQGVLAALGVPYQLVAPQAWKKAVLAGTARDKAAAIAFARRRFPGVSLLATPRSRVAHDGVADALCLAEFARRLVAGAAGRVD